MHAPFVVGRMTHDMKHLRTCRAYQRLMGQRLRMAGIEFIAGVHSYGFWIVGAVNPRTGSEWHSVDEASRVLAGKRA